MAPLSTLISSLSPNNHLYADDTLLFFSFHPLNFDSSISHLQKLFNRFLPGWLPIFLLLTPLRPNSCSSDSKTNSPKYTTLHLTPPTLLEILALSLTNILPSLTKLHLSPKPVAITFVSFAISGFTSILQLPVPLLPLSFTPNLTSVILSTLLSLNYPVCSISRTLLLVLSLKLLSPVISLPSYVALSTGSESMNASNTSSLFLPTKFSQLPNLHTFSSLFIVLVVLALHPSLLLLGHLHHLLKLLIAPFSMLYHVCNQLLLSLRQPVSCARHGPSTRHVNTLRSSCTSVVNINP